MKLRTSFFNTTVLMKNITRFAPAWGIYLIGGMLVMLTVLGISSPQQGAYSLGTTIGPFSVINMIYAAVCAQLLFGDLFNARLCNALHAMPLRREGWFLTNAVSGILFSVVPHLIALVFMTFSLEQYAFVSWIWLLGMVLEHLFFFGLAVACVMCTGSRFAMTVVYGIANFLPQMAYWFIGMFYEPMLYGVVIRQEDFSRLSPVVWLADQELILTRYSFGAGFVREYEFLGLSEHWGYLAGIGALGLVLLAVALVLYRRRALESAGDFMAVKFLKPVFSIIAALGAGAVFALFGMVLLGDYQVFLILGMVVGYFCGQMLLQRTVKVFKPKAFLRLGVLVAVVFASLLLTRFDVLGVTKWIPAPESVESVAVSPSRTTVDQVIFTDPDQIRQITQLHESLAEAGEPQQSDSYLRIVYKLKSGATAERLYRVTKGSNIMRSLQLEFSKPQNVLGYTSSWEEYVSSVERIKISGVGVLPERVPELLEAIRKDCEAGSMAQANRFHSDGEKYAVLITVNGQIRTVKVYPDGYYTVQWIKKNMGI